MSASSVARSPLRPMVPASGWLATRSPRRSISSSGLAPMKPPILKTMHVGYRASSLDSTSGMTNGRLAVTSTWRASTTLPSAPASTRAMASATIALQTSWSSTEVRVNWLGACRGSVNPPSASAAVRSARRAVDAASCGPAIVVIHASLSRRPTTTLGTTSVPGASRTKGSAPRATAPVPGPPRSPPRCDGGQAPATPATAAASARPPGSSMRRATPRPASPKLLVLPQEAVAARGGEQVNLRGVNAGSVAGEACCRDCEAVRSRHICGRAHGPQAAARDIQSDETQPVSGGSIRSLSDRRCRWRGPMDRLHRENRLPEGKIQ